MSDDRPEQGEDDPALPEGRGEMSGDETAAPAIESQPGEASDPVIEHRRLLEALLFASSEPMSERAIAHRLPDGADVPALLAALHEEYAGRGVNLVHTGESWAFRTAADLGAKLAREVEVSRRLSRAAVETLAIIAYHQPITRAEIEEIRGVSLSPGTLDILFEQGWIKPRGRRKTPGRPVTWGTSDSFLDHFGLESLDDLPGIEELKAAGLLDKRPAIHAYRAAGQDDDLDPIAEGDSLHGDSADGDESAEPLKPESTE